MRECDSVCVCVCVHSARLRAVKLSINMLTNLKATCCWPQSYLVYPVYMVYLVSSARGRACSVAVVAFNLCGLVRRRLEVTT